jgi:prepilin-type N-terminal cleavage/methylation domain-containing protein
MELKDFSKFRRSAKGYTLVEIMIVVAILGILVGLAFPNFLKSRAHAQKQTCIENLSQIESAKQIWGVENRKSDGDLPVDADLFGSASYVKIKPKCPGGGVYELRPIGQNAWCPIEGHAL